MTEDAADAKPGKGRCYYPGCGRPSRPDPDKGRPSRYCEQSDPDGGPVHNRANAWKARQAQRSGVAVQEDAVGAPVSIARATLEQHLAELPAKVEELRGFFDGLLADIRAAGDLEAAAAEVQDAHRDAITQVNAAEGRADAAQRAARLAEQRAGVAEREREEADAIAEEAIAETARVREELRTGIEQVRADADAAVARAREELAADEAEHRRRLAERDAEVERARQEANAAQVDAAAAQAAKHAADEALRGLRREFEQHRAEVRSEREAMRAAHAEQLDQMQRNADAHVTTLNEALALARETAETYRTQLGEIRSPPLTQSKQPTSTPKRP
jgi:chromosome segregation ATPase